MPHDIIIVGAGHNGLVTAAYLARAGLRVLVLERRELVGGACVTEELWPGFKVSTASYVNSLLRPEVIRDLELHRHGFELLPRSPSSFTPFPDGRFLLMGPDKELTRQQVGKFSRRDAEALPRYEAMLERVADFIEPTLLQTPPDPWSFRPRDLLQMAGLGWRFLRLGKDGPRALEILTGAARPILDRWFESEQLKIALATDAIIGAMASPSMPGTAYVLFHHVMGECNGVRGMWGYVRGGMGGISDALASAARAHGAEIRVNAAVAKILTRGGRVEGVALEDGTELRARRVPPGAHLRGTIHVAPTLDYMEQAYDDAKYGRPSAHPILECTIPSVVDDTVAPPGKHVMSFFVQYAPYQLRNGGWDQIKDQFADRCFDLLDEYAPNFKRSVIARQVLSPLDLERRFGLTGGNIFQGAMTLSQLFFLRPVPGYADYRSPIKGLYLCGSATHPGGGVMGACGYNAAREILRDGRR